MESEISSRYELARHIAARAAELTLSYYDQALQVSRKADASPVTEADRGAEQLLRQEIRQHFQDDGILGEEFGTVAGSSPFRWILDPIDGTKSFIQGVPLFGTMVAVERAGRGVVGVVVLPALGVSIDAAVGGGAWETRRDGSRVPARVSSATQLQDGLVVTTSWGGFVQREAVDALRALENAAWYLRTWGDCYGYYLVATGRALAMLDPQLNIWDAAALQPILEEAGGTFTDWRGNSTIDAGEGMGTNGHVLAEVLSHLRPQD